MLQEFTICGPEKESCVATKTVNDKSCLVTCAGLYADVEDNVDDVREAVQTLAQELRKGLMKGIKWDYGRDEAKENLIDALQHLLPPAEDAEVKALTEGYHKYKREYVKHLLFNPNFENLSKYSLAFH